MKSSEVLFSKMTVGTKSVLFGVHCFFIHPFIVAIAWTNLYGFPLDPRLWFAFFIHDIGYWGCSSMDGVDGKKHPILGGRITKFLFGEFWGDFVTYHSRGIARNDGKDTSPLCIADKLAWSIEPFWTYLPRAYLSGEIYEYMDSAKRHGWKFDNSRQWYRLIQSYSLDVVRDLQDNGQGLWCSSDHAKL